MLEESVLTVTDSSLSPLCLLHFSVRNFSTSASVQGGVQG